MAITSEPADVLHIRIVLWIFLVLVLAVLVLLVDVPVALGAHLGGANPLSTSTHAEIKGFLKCRMANVFISLQHTFLSNLFSEVG